MKELCNVDRDPLMENLSSSFSVEAARFLAAMFRNSRHKPKGRRWHFEEKVLVLSLLKRSPKSYILLRTLLPLPSRGSLQSILNTVPFRPGINAHVFQNIFPTADFSRIPLSLSLPNEPMSTTINL
jgi:hypothetical protein